jgi:hypothetical protein
MGVNENIATARPVLQQIQLAGALHGVHPMVHGKFAVDVLEMFLHRLDRDDQRLRDRFVRLADPDKPENFQLPIG